MTEWKVWVMRGKVRPLLLSVVTLTAIGAALWFFHRHPPAFRIALDTPKLGVSREQYPTDDSPEVSSSLPTVTVCCGLTVWTLPLFRAYAHKLFPQYGVNVVIKMTDEKGQLFTVPTSIDLNPRNNLPISMKYRMSLMKAGEFDATILPGAYFLQLVERGAHVVAVATLDEESRKYPTHGLIAKTSIALDKPSDLRGLKLGAADGGAQKAATLEFVAQNGLSGKVNIVPTYDFGESKINSDADVVFCNLSTRRNYVDSGQYRVYRPMNWIDPVVFNDLLVFRQDFARTHRPAIHKMLLALDRELRSDAAHHDDRSALIFGRFLPPHAVYPVSLNVKALVELQRLMLKHHILQHGVKLKQHIVVFKKLSASTRAPSQVGGDADP